MTIDVPTRGDHLEGDPRPPKSVGRRTVLAGAAWTVPAVALAAAAPAHAASGLVLAFDKTMYPAVGCTTLTGVSLSVKNGTTPVPAAQVSVVLPDGFAFVAGGQSISGTTDENGVYALPSISVPNMQTTVSISATSGNVSAVASVRVGANSKAALASNGTAAAAVWSNTPPGSVAIGGNYFLSPTNQLWWENNLVVQEVVSAVGWNYSGGDQYCDYILPSGALQRVRYGSVNYDYSGLPADVRPVGQAYFMTEAGDLYHYNTRVTGNVKSIVTWADGTHHADIELKSGVLIRVTRELIENTFSPLPVSAKPIGADFFLSDDGDLFFETDLVVTQVTSAVGWYNATGDARYADYMTEFGQAARAWRKDNPRDEVYTNTPPGARAVGAMYFLTDDGRLYCHGQFALQNVDKVATWAVGGDRYAEVRTTSGSCIRLHDLNIESQWSPMPENAHSIGASYYWDADRQELYYQGKLIATGVTSAFGFHIPNYGDYCDYSTLRNEAIRARYENAREWVRQNIPGGATAIGASYYLAGGILYYGDNGAIVRGVSKAVSWVNGTESVDVQLESGVFVQVINGAIDKTYSSMPQSAAAIGADYFLTPEGELYWQGRFVAGHVTSAKGYYFRGWQHQVCDYVTRDGVAYQAGNERPADRKLTAVKYAEALSRGYFRTDDDRLYWYGDAVKFGDGTPVAYDVIAPWSDQSDMHADIRTPDGKYYRLDFGGVQYQYWQNSTAPQGAVPVGMYYFLTPQGDLYYSVYNDPAILAATGVAEAVGWFDTTRWVACVDYRDDSGVVRRIDNGNSTPAAVYTNAPANATLLGSGYFRSPANDLWFADRDTQTMTKVATNPTSFATWTDPDGFYVTYRPATGQPRRVKGAATSSPSVWSVGDTPLGAKLIGSKYALASTGTLWFAGALVTTGVTDAIGWLQPNAGTFNADYYSDGLAYRANGTTAAFANYAGVPTTAQLLGFGYHLSDNSLLFRGAQVLDNQGNPVVNATSCRAWIDNGDNPFCDYRTQDLGAFRVQRPAGDAFRAWSPNSMTPVGSDPRGAGYFLSDDGVLSYEGQLIEADASNVVGWHWGWNRYADYHVPNGTGLRRLRAHGTVLTDFTYSSPAAGSVPIGSGHWYNSETRDLWYGDSKIAANISSPYAWTWGNPAVNWRDDLNRARRREANVTPPVTTFAQGSTPLGSKPVGADYFLDGDALWYRSGQPSTGSSGPVTESVTRAIGYWAPDGGQYADYVLTTGEAFAVLDGAPTGLDYTNTPESAIPVGCGYFHVPGGELYFNGKIVKDAQGNPLGKVASVVGWGQGARWAAYALIQDC